MNKKGDTFFWGKELGLWIFSLFIIIIVIVIFLSFLGNHIQRQLEVDVLRSNVLTQKLFYDPDCFAYQEGKEIQVGVIDISKFTELNLNNCIKYSKELNGIGMNLKLEYEGNTRAVEINRVVANKYPAFCSDADFSCYETKNYVLVKDSSGMRKGILTINTIQTK